ncbi:hypothetical protein THAOC_24761, partial [Thalassiosira oceanica]
MGLGRPLEAPNILLRRAAVDGRWLDYCQIHLPRRIDGRFESESSKGCLLIHVVSGMPKVVRSTAGSIDSNPMLTLPTVDFLCGREVGASTSSASRRSLPWSETRHVIYRWNGLDVISTTVHSMNMISNKTRSADIFAAKKWCRQTRHRELRVTPQCEAIGPSSGRGPPAPPTSRPWPWIIIEPRRSTERRRYRTAMLSAGLRSISRQRHA